MPKAFWKPKYSWMKSVCNESKNPVRPINRTQGWRDNETIIQRSEVCLEKQGHRVSLCPTQGSIFWQMLGHQLVPRQSRRWSGWPLLPPGTLWVWKCHTGSVHLSGLPKVESLRHSSCSVFSSLTSFSLLGRSEKYTCSPTLFPNRLFFHHF